MTDHAELVRMTQDRVPAATEAVKAAVIALAGGDAPLAQRTIAGYVMAPGDARESVLRVNAYLSAALGLGAARVRHVVKPACGHPGCVPMLAPTAATTATERAVILAMSELAAGDHGAAMDALVAYRAATQADLETSVVQITLAATSVLAELCCTEVATDGD